MGPGQAVSALYPSLHCYPQTALARRSKPLSLTAGWDPCAHVSLSPAPYGASPVFLLSDSEEFLCPPSFGFKTHSVKIATKIRWLSSHYCSLNRLLGFVFFPKDNLLVTKSHLQMSVFSLRKGWMILESEVLFHCKCSIKPVLHKRHDDILTLLYPCYIHSMNMRQTGSLWVLNFPASLKKLFLSAQQLCGQLPRSEGLYTFSLLPCKG